MRKGKKVALLFSMVWTVILLISVTYSWIARSWTPKLDYPQISIGTTGALVITIDDKAYNSVNLNSLTGIEDFALQQVSSTDGINFVSANFSPILEGNVPIYDDLTNGKYIETEFWLKTQYESDSGLADQKKEVYLDIENTLIKCDYDDPNRARVDLAIRISIEIQNGPTYILCKGSNEIDKIYTKNAAPMSSIGSNIFENYPSDQSLKEGTYLPIRVYDLTYFDGNYDDLIKKNRSLFTIDTSSARKITVRIWLEGCDPNCINEIAGSKLSVVLQFNSKEYTSEETTE